MLNYYNGSTVMTDAIGNMLWDGTFTYTWQHGRQLASATKTGTTVSYQYNAEGIRTSKTVNGVLHTYDLSGSSIVRECIYNSTGTYVATELRYYYDAKGAPTAMRVFKRTSATATAQEFVCYFATNLQGDVVALYDEDGNRIASYTYDAWGNNIYKNSTATSNISTADAQWLMNINPFRYRGYYYDTETELYYLQSRYYNPLWGRFINADGYINANGDLIGYNMYAYCSNNPVMYGDPTGENGVMLQISAALLSFVGVAVASCFDEDIKKDMDRIGWNIFNSDAAATVKSSKVSYYKGQFVVREDWSITRGRSGSFVVMFLNSNESGPSGENTVEHEWGHFVQFGLTGISSYTASIAIPSVVTGWLTNSDTVYYSMPWERSAEDIGGAASSSNYYTGSQGLAIAYLILATLGGAACPI